MSNPKVKPDEAFHLLKKIHPDARSITSNGLLKLDGGRVVNLNVMAHIREREMNCDPSYHLGGSGDIYPAIEWPESVTAWPPNPMEWRDATFLDIGCQCAVVIGKTKGDALMGELESFYCGQDGMRFEVKTGQFRDVFKYCIVPISHNKRPIKVDLPPKVPLRWASDYEFASAKIPDEFEQSIAELIDGGSVFFVGEPVDAGFRIDNKDIELNKDRDKIIGLYYKDRKYCPCCGSDSFWRSCGICFTSNPLDHKDTNRCQCKCGWHGIVHDLAKHPDNPPLATSFRP